MVFGSVSLVIYLRVGEVCWKDTCSSACISQSCDPVSPSASLCDVPTNSWKRVRLELSPPQQFHAVHVSIRELGSP